MQITILIPCLDEAESIAFCIKEAEGFFVEEALCGEILVVDNGSQDNSITIIKELQKEITQLRLVREEKKGYGNALRAGLKEATGHYIIMGDADGSYDFRDSKRILHAFKQGADIVIGNRFLGEIQKGAMPFLHRYLGNPILSKLGKLLFQIKINDFHCGLRGITKEAASKLTFTSEGMEFASEMIIKASQSGYSLYEVPVHLYKDKRNKKSHLRSFRDGWRHLKLMIGLRF